MDAGKNARMILIFQACPEGKKREKIKSEKGVKNGRLDQNTSSLARNGVIYCFSKQCA
jgi:hypothetical protein